MAEQLDPSLMLAVAQGPKYEPLEVAAMRNQTLKSAMLQNQYAPQEAQQRLDTGAQNLQIGGQTLQSEKYKNQETALQLAEQQKLMDAVGAERARAAAWAGGTPAAPAATPAPAAAPQTSPMASLLGPGAVVPWNQMTPNAQMTPPPAPATPAIAPTRTPEGLVVRGTQAPASATAPPPAAGVQGPFSMDNALNSLQGSVRPNTLLGWQASQLGVKDKIATINKLQSDTDAANEKLRDAHNDAAAAQFAPMIKDGDFSLPRAQLIIENMRQLGMNNDADQFQKAIAADPDNVRKIALQHAASMESARVRANAAVTTADTGAQKFTADQPKLNAETTQAVRAQAAQTVAAQPDMPSAQAFIAKTRQTDPDTGEFLASLVDPNDTTGAWRNKVLIGAQTPKEQTDNDLKAKEVAKLNTPTELAAVASDPTRSPQDRQMANDALKRMNQFQQAGRPVQQTVNLSPEAMQMYADALRNGKPLPTFGRNGSNTIAGISNLAAGQGPIDMASTSANYKSDVASLGATTKMLDNVEAFEGAAGKNLQQFLDLAKNIPDTGVPWLNTPVRLLSKNIAGDQNMAAIDAARNVALREIARITADPKMSGVLSDSARHEVMQLSPENATLGQIRTVARVVMQDVKNVHDNVAAQKAAIQARIGNGAAAPQSGGVENWVRDKSGKLVKQ